MKIQTAIQARLDLYRAKRNARRLAALQAEAEHIIQAREFSGRLYIAFRGQPLIDASAATTAIPEVLTGARRTWVEYMMRQPKTSLQ